MFDSLFVLIFHLLYQCFFNLSKATRDPKKKTKKKNKSMSKKDSSHVDLKVFT